MNHFPSLMQLKLNQDLLLMMQRKFIISLDFFIAISIKPNCSSTRMFSNHIFQNLIDPPCPVKKQSLLIHLPLLQNYKMHCPIKRGKSPGFTKRLWSGKSECLCISMVITLYTNPYAVVLTGNTIFTYNTHSSKRNTA